MAFKKRIYRIIEAPCPEDWKGKFFDNFMMVLIVTNVLAVILETVESLAAAYGTFFQYFEYSSVAVFSVEYVLRLWTAGESENERFHPPVMGRLRYAMTPMALIDAVAILPFYLAFFLPFDLRFMRVFRLFRLLKLTRYSAALQTLGAAVYGQRRALGATLVIIAILLVFSSSIIYLLEKDAQPEAFGSIPHALWWAVITMTTIGYGDVVPQTLIGRICASVIGIISVGMVALPAGILASGFNEALHKRRATYQRLVDHVLEDGVINQDDQAALRELQEELGLSAHDAAVMLRAGYRKHEHLRATCPDCGAIVEFVSQGHTPDDDGGGGGPRHISKFG